MCEAVGHPVLELERVALRPAAPGRPGAGRAPAPAAARGRAPARAGALTESRAMRLFALRGADQRRAQRRRGDPRRDDRADAGDHGAQRARARARRQLHLHRHQRPRRRVPGGRRARARASSACRCCARARSPCPRSLPRVIRVLIHYYADEGHEPSTSTSARRRRCAPTCSRAVARCELPAQCTIRRWRSSSQSASGASRSTRPRAATPSDAPLVRLASNESPYPPLPAVREAIERRAGHAQPLPGPVQLAAARAPVASATACPRRGSRSATARATSCSPPARRCSSRAPSSSTRGRRSRSTRTSRAASGARAVTVPLDDARAPRPAGDAARDHRRHAPGDRLQPEQPDEHRAAARGDRRVPRRGAAARRA